MPHREPILAPTEDDTILFKHGSTSRGGVVRGWAYRRPGLRTTLIYVEMALYPPPPEPNTFFKLPERKLGKKTVVAMPCPGRGTMENVESFLRGVIEAFEAVVHEAEAKYPADPVKIDEEDRGYTEARAKAYENRRNPGEIDPYRVEMMAE